MNDAQLRILLEALQHHNSGNLARARTGYEALLAEAPDDPEGLHLLGVLEMQEGRAAEARLRIERAIGLRPEEATYRYNLGKVLQAQGLHAEAADALAEAVTRRPVYPEALVAWGASLVALGRHADALERFEMALRLHPTYPEALNNVGSALRVLGRHAESLPYLRHAARYSPDAAEVIENLRAALTVVQGAPAAIDELRQFVRDHDGAVEPLVGLAVTLQEAGHVDEALETWLSALALRPSHKRAVLLSARLLIDQGRLDEALSLLDRAVGETPDHVEALYLLGHTLSLLSFVDLARRVLESALVHRPDHKETHLRLAQLLGPEDAAAAGVHLDRVLAVDPRNLGARLAQANLAERAGDRPGALAIAHALHVEHGDDIDVWNALAKYSRDEAELRRAAEFLERYAREARNERVGVVQVHYTLGDMYDRLGEPDRAFPHFQRANDLRARHYDPAEVQRWFGAIRETYAPERLERLPRSANHDPLPIFIFGLPRSGSSLVEQILASHPSVFGAGEVNHLREALVDLANAIGGDREYPEILSDVTDATMEQLAEVYLAQLRAHAPTARHITDKLPSNFAFAGLIARVLPGARMIHTVRDPLDNALSLYRLNFQGEHGYSYDLDHLGAYVAHYERLMDHWRSIGVELIEVRYEELVADPERQVRALLERLRLPWHDGCLQFHENKRLVKTASYDQVRRPIYTSAVRRSQPYAKWLEPFTRSRARHLA